MHEFATTAPAAASRKRFPREVFTRKMEKLCEAFDNSPQLIACDRLFSGRTLSGTHRLEKLWAVGSYARGAPECGDLDLVLQHSRVAGKGAPSARALVRAAVGTLPFVQYFSGTPESNESGVSFERDAVLLWDGPGSPWRSRLAGIEVDPAAGRAPRETDVLPVSPARLDTDAATLLAAWRAGRIRWRAVSLDLPAGRRPNDLDAFYAAEAWGRATGPRVLPAIEDAIRQLQPRAKWSWQRRSLPRLGSIAVECAGRPRVWYEILEQEGDLSALAVVPHPKGAGPHVIWFIERGSQAAEGQ